MGTFYALVTPGPDSALILGKAYWLADHGLAFSEEGLSLLDVYRAWKASGLAHRATIAGIARWYREAGVTRAHLVSEYNEGRYPHSALAGEWPANYAEIVDVQDYYCGGFGYRKYAPRGHTGFRTGYGGVALVRALPPLSAPSAPAPLRDYLLDLCVDAALHPWGR